MNATYRSPSSLRALYKQSGKFWGRWDRLGCRATLSLLALLASGLGSTAVLAQGGPFGPPGGGMMHGDGPGKGKSQQEKQEIRQKIRTMRAIALANQLELDEGKALKVNALLAEFDEKRMQMHESLRGRFLRIKRASEEVSPDSAALDQDLEKLFELQRDMMLLQRQEFDSIAKLLDPRQRAKLVVFLQRFPEQVRRVMKAQRRERRKQSRDLEPKEKASR